ERGVRGLAAGDRRRGRAGHREPRAPGRSLTPNKATVDPAGRLLGRCGRPGDHEMDDKELLRTVPIFSELTDEDISSLARLALRKRYAKDAVIFFQNEGGDFFFMILDGRIKVPILGDDGREVILSLLGAGDFFGEMALLDNEPRAATAIAVEDSELLSLHRTDFQTVLSDKTTIADSLMRVLSGRLRKANHQISTLALLDVYGRVARVIVDMAREEGRRLKDGRIAFRRATHQEIANRIGTTRETVTRMLKDLERQGLIHVEGKEMVVQPDFEKVFD